MSTNRLEQGTLAVFLAEEDDLEIVDSTTKCNFEGRKERRAAVG